MMAGHSLIQNTTSVHTFATFALLLQNFLFLIFTTLLLLKLYAYSGFGTMNCGILCKDLEGTIRDVMEVLSMYLPVPMKTKFGITEIPTKIRKVYFRDKFPIITVT
jgi:hypothetical protein